MNKPIIFSKLENLKKHFENGKIPILHQHEVNPGLDKASRENYLYFIMTCSLNFQRLSPNTWKSALATYNDETTRFVFFPEIVVKTDKEDLKKALIKYKLALQPNKHIEIWHKLSITWNEYFENDPRILFEKNDFDAVKIINCIQKDMKKNFPYLSGTKLSNYFLFILLEYSDLKLKSTNEISIIPDTHIMKSTKVLGLTDDENITAIQTEALWKELLADSKYSPIDFHSMLWNWSRNGFKPKI